MEHWCRKHKQESISDVVISNRFTTSSTNVVSTLFDDIASNIEEEKGLKSLLIYQFQDQNTLESWPLSQLVAKAPFLVCLDVRSLDKTTADNRSTILNFISEAASFSSCLQKLILCYTKTSAE